MARTIAEIYDRMLFEKQTMSTLNALQPNVSTFQNLLNDLTSASQVAVWRTMYFVLAVAIWLHELKFDEHKEWVENRAEELRVGTTLWYYNKALEFQYGDALVLIDGEYKYASVNTATKIVKLCSVNEINGQLFMKIAKLNASNVPVQLTTLELDAFKAYMQKIKFAGTIINSVSRPADLLQIAYRVYIDPLIINSNGELISNPSIKPIENAIVNYCKNLPFNGIFSVTELTDQLQSVPGVLNPVFENASAQYGTNPFISIGDYYNPNAGYLVIDPAMPLTATINYII